MIFVTVGMHYRGFERLIKKMDEIAGKVGEEVVMQIGSTEYQPKNAKFFDFVDDEKILESFRQASVIVSHAGAGTILTALRFNKPVIVVPRLKRFAEIVDDQQLELTEVLSNAKMVLAVSDVEELEDALVKIEKSNPKLEREKKLVTFLKDYIGSLET